MKRTKPNGKIKKTVERLVGEEPGLASVARLFFYHNLYHDDLFKLEVLASVLNDVAPDSPDHAIAEMIEKLVTTPPAQQEWVRIAVPIIGPTPCDPAPGSPLYVLNEFLLQHPCVLRIKGLERPKGTIKVWADHLPVPLPWVVGMSDKAIEQNRATDRILWLLWEVFYRDIDLTRLKNCSVCHTWFVDHSKNKTKVRCSAACTSQRWSWAERKKAGHHLPGSKAKGESRAKAKKA
jgi:hypothetical protein